MSFLWYMNGTVVYIYIYITVDTRENFIPLSYNFWHFPLVGYIPKFKKWNYNFYTVSHQLFKYIVKYTTRPATHVDFITFFQQNFYF